MNLLSLLSDPLTIALTVIIAATLIGVLHCFSTATRNETYLHELRVATIELKARYLDELRKLQERHTPGEVDVMDDEPLMVGTAEFTAVQAGDEVDPQARQAA